MPACERCDKVGDLACIQVQMPDTEELILALSLRQDGTVCIHNENPDVLSRALGYVQGIWNQTATMMALYVVSGMSSGRPREKVAEVLQAGFTKLRIYGNLDGGLREWMRTRGIEPKDPVQGLTPTQAPGRA